MSVLEDGGRWREAMFESGNRVRFERPVDGDARQWWIDAFHKPFGLTPEGMGDLLTNSLSGEKTIIYRTIDGVGHSFAVRVEGRFRDDGEFWLVERSLHLEGSLFSADRMFIPGADAQAGRGRRLMADLLDAAQMLGIARISVEAERIGRYAWLRMGFVPDRGSWRNIQIDALRYLQRQQRHLGHEAERLIAVVSSGGPNTARMLAAMNASVPSLELHARTGEPMMVPFGKAFFLEAGPNWTGEFNFDPESLKLAEDYAGRPTQLRKQGT